MIGLLSMLGLACLAGALEAASQGNWPACAAFTAGVLVTPPAIVRAVRATR